MTIVPITLRQARGFVGKHHRHNLPSKGWKFGVGLTVGDSQLVGVGMAGQPVSRRLDDGLTIEITRVCTDGTRNANSMIYGALSRAAFALGYRRIITYTLQSESGASLRAAGFKVAAELPSTRGWDRSGRPRVESDLFGRERTPHEAKVRWEKAA